MGSRCEAAWWRGPLSPGAATAQLALPPRSGYLQRPEFVRSLLRCEQFVLRDIDPSQGIIPDTC